MEQLIKDAYRLRYEYYNTFEGKESQWHEQYNKHKLYEVVVKSFEYDFKQIGQVMPELIKKSSFKGS